MEGKCYGWQLQSGQVVHSIIYCGSAAVVATILTRFFANTAK